MTTPDHPATFYWPAYADMSTQPTARLHDAKDGVYSVIKFGGALTAHLHTPAQCDALIRAAVAAKDLLLAAQQYVIAPECARGDHHACHDDNTTHPCECCLNGHKPTIGAPAPLSRHCPVCGTPLDSSGEHVTRSGARIAAGAS